jgi:hypothetical protein
MAFISASTLAGISPLGFAARHWKAIFGGIAFALLLGWALRVDHLRERWKGKHEALTAIAGDILGAVRLASDKPKLKLADAAEQVALIGEARRAWKATSQLQSSRIDALGIEAARLTALNADLRARAEKAIAKRESAIKRLERQRLDPGERADCAAQIFAANAALDLVYHEGL